ncbi:hypothetical protein A0H76_474 [Hepatospora eriocheir]|uniref:Uncharacterized protein n=1 Tax=Hepatospora eriocheir TaxID=1081669 RepID=A0A1X0QIQ2_9MICR|nr:hypothetical protein A0H76_474 [Hepatospora eriocheir]
MMVSFYHLLKSFLLIKALSIDFENDIKEQSKRILNVIKYIVTEDELNNCNKPVKLLIKNIVDYKIIRNKLLKYVYDDSDGENLEIKVNEFVEVLNLSDLYFFKEQMKNLIQKEEDLNNLKISLKENKDLLFKKQLEKKECKTFIHKKIKKIKEINKKIKSKNLHVNCKENINNKNLLKSEKQTDQKKFKKSLYELKTSKKLYGECKADIEILNQEQNLIKTEHHLLEEKYELYKKRRIIFKDLEKIIKNRETEVNLLIHSIKYKNVCNELDVINIEISLLEDIIKLNLNEDEEHHLILSGLENMKSIKKEEKNLLKKINSVEEFKKYFHWKSSNTKNDLEALKNILWVLINPFNPDDPKIHYDYYEYLLDSKFKQIEEKNES